MNTKILLLVLTGIVLLPHSGSTSTVVEPSYAVQVKAKRVFPEPMDWTGSKEPSSSESAALLEALDKFETASLNDGIDALEAFVTANPQSGWAPTVHMNLAEFYRGNGRYTLALQHWAKAWAASKDDPNFRSQRVAARVVGGWTRLLASLGQKDQLSEIFKEVDQLQLALGTYGSMVQGTKGGLATMIARPGLAYRCGSFALGHVARELHLEAAESLFQAESPDGGFHLDQLLELAQSHGISLVAVRRPAGAELVAPSVIHWRLNHYAAILGKQGERYRVMDPTFGGEVWMDPATIEAEASGAFLIPKDRVPPGWTALNSFECAQIYGKGYPNDFSDDEDEGPDPCDSDEADSNCDPPSSGDGPPPPQPPPCGCGMPIWKVSEPYITLWLEDTPLLYRMSNQQWKRLYLRYKHTGEYKGSVISSFGDKFECNFLGFLTLSTNNLNYYTNHMAGGGIQAYSASGLQDYRTGRWLISEPGHGLAIVTVTSQILIVKVAEVASQGFCQFAVLTSYLVA